MLTLAATGVSGIIVAGCVTNTLDQVYTPENVYVGQVRAAEGPDVIELNGERREFLPNQCGWAVFSVSNDRNDRNEVQIRGWVLDPRNNSTAQDILVFGDDELVTTKPPWVVNYELKDVSYVAGRRPGFDIRLSLDIMASKSCIRVLAVLQTGEIGTLYYRIEGNERISARSQCVHLEARAKLADVLFAEFFNRE